MGRFFSNPVEQALDYIYYDLCSGKADKGMLLLEEAAAYGDGDACCILARCLSGRHYVWAGHKFPKDDYRARRFLEKSLEQDSPLGILMVLHSRQLSSETPLSCLQEAFHAVLKKAGDGEPLCQYMIGNVYLGQDFLRITGKTKDSFASEEEFNRYMSENICKCENWFWKSFRGGMFFAGNNLYHYYMKGCAPYVLPAPEKAKDLWHIGAEIGYPIHQYILATILEKSGHLTEALRWYKAAAHSGEPNAWAQVGRFYEKGIGVSQDIHYAIGCYEAGWKRGDIDSGNHLDALLRRG